MGNYVRLLIGVPIAGAITLGLFLMMRYLIIPDAVVIEEEQDALNISIAEDVAEVDARRREVNIDDVDQIDPPPPPPQIERAAAEQPTESLGDLMGSIPAFDSPSLGADNVNFSVSDRDAQPLVRIEPQYPPRALERGLSGDCLMEFDVTAEGSPTNVRVLNCASSLFERASIRAVQRWRYNPKMENGVAVPRYGVQTNLVFRLAED
ncbi:MAG: energy transducer TonB [Maricaulis sp.]|jgi:protein TonB|nr:energy transducer TonB [Maricaulis sp.]